MMKRLFGFFACVVLFCGCTSREIDDRMLRKQVEVNAMIVAELERMDEEIAELKKTNCRD